MSIHPRPCRYYGRGTLLKMIDKGAIKGLEFASLLCDLEDALGKHVDLISTRGAEYKFLDEVRKDEVLMYERK